MAKLFEDENYASSDDEDYVPTVAENTKADQELASLQKQEKKDSDNEQDQEEELPDEMFSFLNEGGEENGAASGDGQQEDSTSKDGTADDFVGKIQEFPGDIKATTVVPGLRYMVKTVLDFCGELVEEEKEMSKEELDDLVAKSATNTSRKRKAVKVDGLDVALKSLEKKKKISLIDKTDLDWKTHVQKKGIETTLSSFEKSRKNIVDHLNFKKKAG